MRPTRDTLTRLATALDAALAGSVIDRVWRPAPAMLLLDVRRLGKARLLVDVDARHPRVIVTTRWPDTPAAPDRETIGFRKFLEGQRIVRVVPRGERQLALEGANGAWSLVVQLAGRYPNVAAFDGEDAELIRLFEDRPGTDPDSPALPPGAVQGEGADATDSDWLAAYAALTWDDWDARHVAERRAGLEREVRGARERLGRTLRALDRELAEAEDAARVRHQGELLKTVLRTVPAGASEAVVSDWADPDGRDVTIALDPLLTPAKNLERLFQRYRKLERKGREAEARWLAASELDAKLAVLQAAVAAAADEPAFAAAERGLRALGVRAVRQAPPRHADAPRLPYRRFLAADGSEIWVGRSAKDNDALTFRRASGRDLFLHARDVPGSHVILRRPHKSDAPPPAEALADAAALAAWHSRARGEGVIDVLWTERKHVRKARGANAGQVSTAATHNVMVRADPARITRLYATLDPADRGEA